MRRSIALLFTGSVALHLGCGGGGETAPASDIVASTSSASASSSGSGRGGSGGAGGAGATGGHGASASTGTGGQGGAGGGGGSGGGVTGKPSAQFDITAIDFGLVDCGGVAPVDKTLTITNKGTAPLKVTASLGSATAFSISDGASGTVPAGKSAAIVISAAAIPSNSVAGATVSATLTIKTDDSAHASTDIQVKITPQGGTLTLSPTTASFGQSSVSLPAGDIPLTLSNTGNAPVSLSFTAPADTQFGLAYTGSPDPVILKPNTAVPGLAATFTPATISPSQTSAAIAPTGAICGVSVASIPMSGQGTNGAFGVSTSDLYFGPNSDGNVDCGTKATAKTFTLTNTGNKVYNWNASLALDQTSPFSVSPTSGNVLPNQAPVTITVTPLASIPGQSSTQPDLYGDVLSISTDIAGDSAHPITLHQTAHGAILALGPAGVDFGNITTGSTTDNPFTLSNVGNATANATLSSSNAFYTLSPVGPQVVAGGGSVPGTVTFAPTNITPQAGTISVAVAAGDVLCAPLPTPIDLTGTGLSAGVSFSPLSIDFRQVDCGTTAPSKTIVFKNTGNADYHITDYGFGVGTAITSPHYVLSVSPQSKLVAAGGTLTITVDPKQIPATSAVTPNLYGDLVRVTTDAPLDSPHYIPLFETARGAIISYSTNNVPFGGVLLGGNSRFSLGLTNSGNVDFTGILSGTAAPFTAQPSIRADQAGSGKVPLTFGPTLAGSFADKVSITADANQVLCQPLPGPINLSGKGKALGVTASVTELDFGAPICGAAAAKAILAKVENPYPTAVTLTPVLGKGTSSFFTVTPPSLAVPSGQVAIFTIIPKAIVAPASTAFQGFDDVLTFVNVTVPTDPAESIFLHMTATGAILNLSPVAVQFPDTLSTTTTTLNGTFFVFNTGNFPSPKGTSFLLSDPTDFSVPAIGIGVDPRAPLQQIITFKPALPAGAKGGSLTLTTTATTGLCAPLPSGIMLIGNGK